MIMTSTRSESDDLLASLLALLSAGEIQKKKISGFSGCFTYCSGKDAMHELGCQPFFVFVFPIFFL